jgi:hypothetical protein
MRDIRRDLQDRAHLLEEEINAAHMQFEQQVEQLKVERDARIQDLKDELGAVGRLIEAEQRRMDQSVATPAQPAAAAMTPNQQVLADSVLRKLTESGPMSIDELRRWSLQEGFFGDPDSAARGMQATLMTVAKNGRIRQLPNGTLAPALLMDTIRARQAN